MPSRQVHERQLAKEAAARDVTINITIRPSDTVFQILKSQLAVLVYFADYLPSLNRNNNSLQLEGFHPALFNFLVQWVVRASIWPLRDNSLNKGATRSIKQLVIPTNSPIVTFSTLFDTKFELYPSSMPTARSLIQAYFMGQRMQAHHFMDCILNLITRYLRVDSAPHPLHIHEIYERANTPALQGLKKLLVDAYIWANHVTIGQIQLLSTYRPDFQAHVNETVAKISERRYGYDAVNTTNPRNQEFRDVRIDFARLQACLCNDSQGRLKCRYHLHGSNEPCWHMIVDDAPVANAARVLPAGEHRH